MKRLPIFLIATAVSAFAPAASACTLCDSATAAQVRATLLGADLWSNLAALAAPVPALVAAIIALHHLSR